MYSGGIQIEIAARRMVRSLPTDEVFFYQAHAMATSSTPSSAPRREGPSSLGFRRFRDFARRCKCHRAEDMLVARCVASAFPSLAPEELLPLFCPTRGPVCLSARTLLLDRPTTPVSPSCYTPIVDRAGLVQDLRRTVTPRDVSAFFAARGETSADELIAALPTEVIAAFRRTLQKDAFPPQPYAVNVYESAAGVWLRKHGLLDNSHRVEVSARCFMFAARFHRSSHDSLAERVRRCGGLVCEDQECTPDVDYLVVGEHERDGLCAATSTGNRRLRSAVKIRLGSLDDRPRIITESRFLEVLTSLERATRKTRKRQGARSRSGRRKRRRAR